MKSTTMSGSSRFLIALSSALLILAYLLPLWRIELEAPQYPEGLAMKIWLHGLSGNVDQINGLNHYIGMKHIAEEEFWEFKVMPYVFAVLIVFGFLTAYFNRRSYLRIWVLTLVVFAGAGLADFYMWEYDYGHNLNPMAAIKVEGMTYQPPLIGYKQLLNFLAGSFPDIGGVVVGFAGLLAAGVLFKEERMAQKESLAVKGVAPLFIALIIGLFSGCSSGPQEIVYGKDVCEHCKMLIMDKKYGAEVITPQGRVYKFDAAECMVSFLKDKAEIQNNAQTGLLVIDIAEPGKLIDARTSIFLHDKNFKSPMGGNLAAFHSQAALKNYTKSSDGEIYTWNELLARNGEGEN